MFSCKNCAYFTITRAKTGYMCVSNGKSRKFSDSICRKFKKKEIELYGKRKLTHAHVQNSEAAYQKTKFHNERN